MGYASQAMRGRPELNHTTLRARRLDKPSRATNIRNRGFSPTRSIRREEGRKPRRNDVQDIRNTIGPANQSVGSRWSAFGSIPREKSR